MYLPSGEYRVKAFLNSSVYYSDFFVKPRNIQRYENKFFKAEKITLSYKPPAGLPLRVFTQVINSLNGDDITSLSEIYIHVNGKKQTNFKNSITKR
jgi:hypothetical protein